MVADSVSKTLEDTLYCFGEPAFFYGWHSASLYSFSYLIKTLKRGLQELLQKVTRTMGEVCSK